MTVFEEAHADCLKKCFETLAVSIDSIDESTLRPGDATAGAEARFSRCCEKCRQTKQIADRIRPEKGV